MKIAFFIFSYFFIQISFGWYIGDYVIVVKDIKNNDYYINDTPFSGVFPFQKSKLLYITNLAKEGVEYFNKTYQIVGIEDCGKYQTNKDFCVAAKENQKTSKNIDDIQFNLNEKMTMIFWIIGTYFLYLLFIFFSLLIALSPFYIFLKKIFNIKNIFYISTIYVIIFELFSYFNHIHILENFFLGIFMYVIFILVYIFFISINILIKYFYRKIVSK